jgi:hypothetical protein
LTVDISPIVQALVAIAAATITGAIPIVTLWLNKHLKISQDSILATRVATGVTAMAQIANSEIASIGAHNLTVQVKNVAVANALSKASVGFNAAAAASGTTPAMVASRVDGALAAMLTAPIPVAPIPPAREA